jgi:signal transduction histidine kinase
MSLRLKLLLLGLATLVLPWAGCNYARQMETALREGEQTALQSVSQTIATSLQGRADLLYRDPHASEAITTGPYDLEPVVITTPPYLDGYVDVDEWPRSPESWRYYTRDKNHRFGVLTAVHKRMLYILVDVTDRHPVFDLPGGDPLDSARIGDRIWIGFQDATGTERQIFVSTPEPGQVTGRRITTGEYGQQTAEEDPRVTGAWGKPGPQGYKVELRMPLSMIGGRFGMLIDDRDERGATPVSYGSLRSDDLRTIGRLIVASPDLTAYLTQFRQPGMRLTVTTPRGRVLANVDALAESAELGRESSLLASFYSAFVNAANQSLLIDATKPVYDQEHSQTIALLRVTQTPSYHWHALRDQALTSMLSLTLVVTVLAVAGTFTFAGWLALRLSRLRTAAESALTREGLVTSFPETQVGDELGDVARSFATLLRRLNEYTGYLRTLAGKLAHEIRTPLTIIRSSLDNLESEQVPEAARLYLTRARQGSERLSAILVAMGAATRVEEAIGSAERTQFDLVPVVASAAAAYRIAFPQRQFATELPATPGTIDGAPDLIVQLLDKLIDNAVDFSPAGSTITIRLALEPSFAVLEVDNSGPALPPQIRGKLFESLWQSRGGKDGDSRPHFGLGLYIVRLIAEFHAGVASATSLPGDSGARFSVRFPLAVPEVLRELAAPAAATLPLHKDA